MKRIFLLIKNCMSSLTFTVPIAVTFIDGVAYVAKVEGVSMQPCLNPEDDHEENDYFYNRRQNDYVLLSHWSVRNYDVERGQIVALISPKDPKQKIIKRIIGLEGDIVFTKSNHGDSSFRGNLVKIPKGHCWVEGDHHAKSMDSNYFGPVALGLITSHAICIVWPPKRWQWLTSEIPDERRIYPYS